MSTFIATFFIICLSFIGFGVGVLFFGKTAERSRCGEVPQAAHEDCPSQKAGLCPIEDTTGALKVAKMNRLSFHKPSD